MQESEENPIPEEVFLAEELSFQSFQVWLRLA